VVDLVGERVSMTSGNLTFHDDPRAASSTDSSVCGQTPAIRKWAHFDVLLETLDLTMLSFVVTRNIRDESLRQARGPPLRARQKLLADLPFSLQRFILSEELAKLSSASSLIHLTHLLPCTRLAICSGTM
jgi:hypothetical protein